MRTHISDMSYEQLRTAFDRTATLRERVRAFRLERVNQLIAGNTGCPMVGTGPVCVIHCIPLQAVADAELVNVAALNDKYDQFIFGTTGASRSLNLDGIVVYPPGTVPAVRWYVQVFRTGALEVVRYVGELY